MGQRICSVPGCERKHDSRGLCLVHYQRLRSQPGFKPLEREPRHSIVERDDAAKRGVCALCGPVDILFGGTRKNGRRYAYCAERSRAKKRELRAIIKSDPGLKAEHNLYHARYARAKKYGITREEMDSLLDGDLACAICGTALTPGTAHLDHDHNCCPPGAYQGCGKCLRGVLCKALQLWTGQLQRRSSIAPLGCRLRQWRVADASRSLDQHSGT